MTIDGFATSISDPYIDVRQQLQSILGISPCDEFCQRFYSAADGSPVVATAATDITAMDLLDEILYEDLRTVVRGGESQITGRVPCHAARALRSVVRQSMIEGHKATSLPEKFRLLVQIEEVVDVSVNFEHRFQEKHYNTNSSTSSSRLFKILYTDGYWDENSACGDPMATMVAMEVAPVPGLTALAGIKVVLSGPMVFRHGVAGWHPGNVTVLGGRVDALVSLQQAKIAQLRAGNAVDVTLRALVVQSNNLNNDETEQDEGEYESRDVENTPPSSDATNQTLASSQQYSRPLPEAVTRTMNDTTTTSSSINPYAPAMVSQRTTIPPITTSKTTRNGESFPVAAALSTAGTISSTECTPVQTVPQALAADTIVSRSTHPSTQTQRNPYFSSTATLLQPTTTYQSNNSLPQQASLTRASTAGMEASSLFQAFLPSHSFVPTRLQQSDIQTSTLVMPYGELYDLLLRAIRDQDLYKRLYGTTYVVQLQQVGPKLHFNIEKQKKKQALSSSQRSKGEEKQYEYVMIAKYRGADENSCNDPDNSCTNGRGVTCKVGSSILEPHFAISPGEMRKLNKHDRCQADVLVREGGRLVQAAMIKLESYEVSLLGTPEEFFLIGKESAQRILDGNDPILLMARKIDK